MKLISLFTKSPQHQRFSYRPRFYDPLKEEIQERENRIKQELDRQKGILNEEVTQGYRTRIAGSFQAARKRSKPSFGGSATMIRLFILLFLTVLIIAYLEFGRSALYLLALFVPFYLYLKFKSR
ncbi:MAG: hypothetical protein MUF39_06660 [Cyclobacteriaceae bacterium]|jgi:hypothetical protein|nr:hypothetical protein [Cyclobacteriaceae bacterium]